MSGIGSMLRKKCKQTAVYWGNPQGNGYTERTYDDPVEIKCRWKERLQVITDEFGVTHLSRATVVVLQDLKVEGCLYLGTLASLEVYLESSSGTYINPTSIPDGVCIVKRFEKTPELGSTTNFLRRAFLTPWLT